MTDSGFLDSSPTLQVALMADNSLLQVHNNGIRHIRADKLTNEWKAPNRKIVLLAAVNARQAAVAIQGGEIIYFEIDAAGMLVEMGNHDMGKEISCLDIGVVPTGRARCMFLAVGCWDDTVQLLSLDPSDVLGKGPSFHVESRPTSLCLIEMAKESSAPAGASGSSSSSAASTGLTSLYLNVGLEKGVLMRVAVDPVTGDFSDARQKFLGPRAIKLCRVTVQGASSVMALTTRAWLMYNYQNRYHQDPLSYEMLEHVSDFSSEACPGGLVAVAGSTLRIVTIDNLGAMYNQIALPLRYTPRKMTRFPGTSDLVIVEADHNEFNETERAEVEKRYDAALKGTTTDSSSSEMEISAAADHKDGHNNSTTIGDEVEKEEEDDEGTVMPIRGPVPGAEGRWASCVRVLNVNNGTTKCVLELPANEAAFSVCTCKFPQHSEETFIIVGTCKDLTLHPKRWTACFLHVYRLLGDSLQLLHRTEVEDVPLCMIEFQGRLLVGIGRCLRMYDLGKRKLLKKCENKSLPAAVVRLQCSGDRIFVGDMMESVLFVKYRRHENVLATFADDAATRFV